MGTEDDIVDVVDEIVDDMNVTRMQDEAERLDIGMDVLIQRVVAEVRSRTHAGLQHCS
jgi:hypothetical protein